MNLDLNVSIYSEGSDEESFENRTIRLASDGSEDEDSDGDVNKDGCVGRVMECVVESDTEEEIPNCSIGGSRDSIRGSENVVESDSLEKLKQIVEKRICLGSCIDTLDEVYVMYCEYARLMGFSVKKGTQLYFMNSLDVRAKVYHCSCDRTPDEKSSSGVIPSYKKQMFRTNCKARLRVGRDEVGGPWKVIVFYKEHNHPLVCPDESYLLRSARNMTESKKTLFMALSSSGIGVSRGYSFLEKEAGSRSNVGFIPKDAYNALYLERRIMTKGENGDSNKLIEYFTRKSRNDPSFYWSIKICDEGRLNNLFFRDTRCLIDYQYFGDVVSVDSTHKTNKYGLICVPIIGINHHRCNVMFGVAFLKNETTESYQWLFQSFLESMYKKEPCIIFSDQDKAIMNGIDLTFPNACHRLCQWHINKNATKHFGKLNQNVEFKRKWYRCMNGCESGEEFEQCWKDMIESHDLSDNRWFTNMYTLRKRWSSAFTRDRFPAGLHATSRSEVTNKVLKDLCSSSSTLCEFVEGFEKVQTTWRSREKEEDSLCRGMPGQFVQRNMILIKVGEICTRNVFKSFQYEAVNSLSVKLTQEAVDMNVAEIEFKVSSTRSYRGYRVVTFNEATLAGRCSCRMWESEGIICRHLFRVYFHLNLDNIADDMIIPRWRKDAKNRPGLSNEMGEDARRDKFADMVFVHHNTKLVYDMLYELKEDMEKRDAVNQHIRALINMFKRKRPNTEIRNSQIEEEVNVNSDDRRFRDPLMKMKTHRRGRSDNDARDEVYLLQLSMNGGQSGHQQVYSSVVPSTSQVMSGSIPGVYEYNYGRHIRSMQGDHTTIPEG